jgi:uncharacterized protein
VSDQTLVAAKQTTVTLSPAGFAAVDSAERMTVLDVLRGFALLGIVLANVHAFAGLMFPEALGMPPATTADNVTMGLTHLLITGKFYSLFSLLFGVGFFVFLQRAEAKGMPAVPLFRRRLRWLLVIGLLHALFLWAGDILTVYALVGFLLVPFRRLSHRTLLPSAAALLTLPVVAYALMWMAGVGDPFASAPDTAPAVGAGDDFDAVGWMVDGFRGGYGDVLLANAMFLVGRWIDLLITLRFPKVLGMFLIGFWIGRAGLARDLDAHAGLFRRVLVVGVLVGLPANAYLAWATERVAYLPGSLAGFLSTVASAAGVPSLALAYAAGMALLMRRARAARLLGVLAPVGRMALTNYLLQTLACALVFYGYGLGLMGSAGPAQAALIALAIFALQVPLSVLWLRYYAFGPAEWVWRRLTYRARLNARAT